MVDRRSSYDDSRGMGEGVLDSRSTSHKNWILFEPQKQSEMFEAEKSAAASGGSTLPSAVAHQLSRFFRFCFFLSGPTFYLMSNSVLQNVFAKY
jgi:hypothetical protein